ncbi:MAG: hypothetical protein PWQ31_1309 [Eubacteriales bacterium]|nr:hypothetical protein [Eubacteriales bacterium]
MRIKLLSPLLVGGRKLTGQLMESLPYIPGEVFKAAVARYIAKNCVVPVKEKQNWVSFQNQRECSQCPLADLCRDFPSLSFSNGYPILAGKKVLEPAPLTARVCKYNGSHRLFDSLKTLIHNTEVGECPDCLEQKEEKVRTERAKGFMYRDKESKAYFPASLIKYYRYLTRTAIDPYRQVAADGQLYTMKVLDGDLEFEFYALGGVEALSPGMELQVGGRLTYGYGRVEVVRVDRADGDSPEAVLRRLEKFNKKEGPVFIPLLLVSDLLPGNRALEEIFQEVCPEGEIHCRYLETSWWRGFDTSGWAEKRKPLELRVNMGSVVVLAVPREAVTEELVRRLVEQGFAGVGEKREWGYGRFRVMHPVHLAEGGKRQ